MRLFMVACLLLSHSLFAAEHIVPDVTPDKISEHVYVIHGPAEFPNVANRGFMNNPAFAITEDSVVVLDPGSSRYAGEMVLRQIAKLTDKPVSDVFISHVHGDHWLGNQAIREAYPEVRLHAHPNMIKTAHAGAAADWISRMSGLTEGFTDGTVAVIPESELKDGEEKRIGGLTFRVYLNQHAHTKTDAMIEVVEDSLIVLGDNALHHRIARMDDASFRGNIAALQQALELNLKHYVPGHGPTAGPEAASLFRDYLQTIYAAASEGMDEGLEAFEIKNQLRPKLSLYHAWSGFDSEFGKHVSLAFLEAEAAAFE